MHTIHYRDGDSKDIPFMKEMLYEAVLWNQAADRPPLDKILSIPDISKILDNWGDQAGDFSLIAVNDPGQAVGAVWYRFWTEENHSYGFVNEETPELGIALKSEIRRQGVGSFLVKKAMIHAKKAGIKNMSLSVEATNPARKLYEKLGFKKVVTTGDSWTMMARL